MRSARVGHLGMPVLSVNNRRCRAVRLAAYGLRRAVAGKRSGRLLRMDLEPNRAAGSATRHSVIAQLARDLQ